MLLITLFIIGLLGLAIGSFLNVLILRSIGNEKLTGRSHCPNCKHNLSVGDLVPLFSYLILRGKCRYCQKKISWQYPLVEAATMVLFSGSAYLIFSYFNFSFNVHVVFGLATALFAIGILLAVFVTDLKWGLIPNRIIIPGILILVFIKILYLVMLVVLTFLAFSQDTHGFGKYLLPPYSDHIFVIMSRYGVGFLYDLFTGLGIGLAFYLLIVATKGRAMGGGDIKLGLFIGLLNGWPLGLVALMISFTTGALVSVLLLTLRKKKIGQTIPFGPFLAVSSLITLFWGEQIFNWYAGLMK